MDDLMCAVGLIDDTGLCVLDCQAAILRQHGGGSAAGAVGAAAELAIRSSIRLTVERSCERMQAQN
eukprot:2239412-Amphidinium_carterae.1